MNLKWPIALLVIILAFIGVSVEQPVAHNQEIVVQFNTGVNASQQAEKAIASVKEQLAHIGIQEMQITATLEGTLKITYYSDADVTAVKTLFEAENEFAFSYDATPTNSPFENSPFSPDSQAYAVNVSEIPTHSDNGLGLTGTLLELKSANDHYVPPVVFFRVSETSHETNKAIEAHVVSCYTDTTLRTDRASYKIPEVRAGPIA